MNNPETGPPSPEVGPEMLPEAANQTTRSIENVGRMQAKKAEALGAYQTLAPLAPEGFSSVGGPNGSEVFVMEDSAHDPGEVAQPTILRIKGSGLKAEVSTVSGNAKGSVMDQTGDVIGHLDNKDIRRAAAEALWQKRQELNSRRDRITQAGKVALDATLQKQ